MVESNRFIAPIGAGVVALGVGLLGVAGAAVAGASPDDSSSSSSDSGGRTASQRSDSGDRASAERDRARSSTSQSARETSSGPRSEGGKSPSDTPDDDAGEAQPDRDADAAAKDNGTDSRSAAHDDDVVDAVEEAPDIDGSAGNEPSIPDPVSVAPPVSQDAGAAEVAEVSAPTVSVRYASTNLDGERRALLRARASQSQRSTVSLSMTISPSVPSVPSVPGSPALPGPGTWLGAMSLLRRDLELQEIYGDPTRNGRYYRSQVSGDCVLMSSAMVIGQITGKMPTALEIVYQAMRTQTLYDKNGNLLPEPDGRMMYRGLKNYGKWTLYGDAQVLMKHYGVDSTLKTFAPLDGQPDRREEALEYLKQSLADPDNAVMVSVHPEVLWHTAIDGMPPYVPARTTRATHAVVVLGYDATNEVVIINDSWLTPDNPRAAEHYQINPATGEPWGQELKVPLAAFLEGWKKSNYLSVVGFESADGPSADRPTWQFLMPRRQQANFERETGVRTPQTARTQ